ncbi:hypothetical protein NA57DRAFT_80936 [Rhizodiscina lignyota]|uniref:Acyltransferase 3 domain-containing protein n=1 Tax=Rhizodiscina lignyota TaxID=1504668 RepID=A0A9P4I8X8_9PEZI|nr:hypothetical protein NA57DRAFT_80936 [Rhizodiscina lignyota]
MASPRLHYLSNLRTYLTVVVIYHHTAIPYGGDGSWGYKLPKSTSNPALTAFNALNQTYFMAGFFFLSGFFSHRSATRKSSTAFIKDKVLRLGLPTFLYALVVEPIQTMILQVVISRTPQRSIADIWIQHFKNIRGVQGPVWYCALLLIFDIIYALLFARQFTNRSSPPEALSRSWLLSLVATIAYASFLLRIPFPVSEKGVLNPLNLRVGYVTQYIGYYALGHIVGSRGTPDVGMGELRPPGLALRLWAVTIATSVLSGFFHGNEGDASDRARGGLNVMAVCYAILNETVGYLILTGLVGGFRRWSFTTKSWGFVPRYAYAAFLVHVPTVITLQALFDRWDANGVLKTLVVGTLSVPAAWLVGCIIANVLPGARKVIL